jgi:hypothetical protein
MFAVLHYVSFVLLSSRLLSPGCSAITARSPALAASRFVRAARLDYFFSQRLLLSRHNYFLR